jgi:hypothetical protein
VNAGHLSTRTDKIAFLSKHRELWDKTAIEIKKRLVDAGLVRPSTYVLDLRISDLIKAAKKLADDAGQTLAEFAVILPIFVFVGFVMADIVWLTRTAAAIEYVVNEAARCEAIGSLACAAPNSPQSYATNLAQNLRLNSASAQLSTPPCSPQSCSVSIAYQYKPLGAWFPSITISRTGTASVSPSQERQP